MTTFTSITHPIFDISVHVHLQDYSIRVWRNSHISDGFSRSQRIRYTHTHLLYLFCEVLFVLPPALNDTHKMSKRFSQSCGIW